MSFAPWLPLGIFLSHCGSALPPPPRRGPVGFFLCAVNPRGPPAGSQRYKSARNIAPLAAEHSRPAASLLLRAKRRLLPRRAESIIGP